MSESKRIDRISESLRIIAEGEKQGATLRMIGGLAARVHCEDLEFCEREYGDVDLVGLESQTAEIRTTFESLGYTENRVVARSTDETRLLFQRGDYEDHVDVFLDKLRMEHTIDLRGRLQVESLTVSVSDILITKLIIHNMNEKDYRDIFSIMKDKELGRQDRKDMINVEYIASLCSRNWGLFQDIMCNINQCIEVLDHYNFSQSENDRLRSRFLAIKEAIGSKRKSFRWKLRAILGNSIPTREVVEGEELHPADWSSELPSTS